MKSMYEIAIKIALDEMIDVDGDVIKFHNICKFLVQWREICGHNEKVESKFIKKYFKLN